MAAGKVNFALPGVSSELFRREMEKDFLCQYERIILTGAGWCYTAAQAAVPAFRELCKVNVRVCHMLEILSGAEKELKGTLFVILVDPENCMQEVECVEYAKENGAFTLAIMAKAFSDMENISKQTIHVERLILQMPDRRAAVYGGYIQTLFYLALYLAQEKGKVTKEESCSCEKEIQSYIEEMNQWLISRNADIYGAAKEWVQLEDFESIGLGDEHSAAAYCGGEIVLECKCLCSCENIEEWCHLNFFIRENKKIGTLIFADAANEGMMRIQEAVYVIKRMKRPSILFTDAMPDMFVPGMKIYQIPAAAHSWISPAGIFAPGVLFVYYLAAEQKRGIC